MEQTLVCSTKISTDDKAREKIAGGFAAARGRRAGLYHSGRLRRSRLGSLARRPGPISAKRGVARLNHRLRGEESDEDEAFVRDLANRLNLSVFTERIAVAERAKEEKQNLEAVARRLRYEFLLRVAEARGAKIVFTAHTLDDQAETILMRLIRGSGAEGLRGVHHVVALSDDVKLIRPMLGIKRAEVIAHCERYELAFRSDSSNFLADFTRNRVRLELLPMLETFNPRVKESLARTSESGARDEDYLRGAASEYLAGSRGESGLNVRVLREAPDASNCRKAASLRASSIV